MKTTISKTTISISILVLFVCAFSSVSAFAQGATTTTAASTAVRFTSVSPTVLVSDAKTTIFKTVSIRGRNLKGLAEVIFVDRTGDEYPAAAADNSNNNSISVRFELSPNENDIYTIKGENITLRTYDPETNTLRVNAAAGANAAKEVAALKKELEAQKTAQSTTAEKIVAYEKQLAELASKQTTVNTTVKEDASLLANERIGMLGEQIAQLKTTVTAQGTELAQVKTAVTSVDELVLTTADYLSRLANIDQMPRRERNPTKAAANRAVLEAIAKRNQDRFAAIQQVKQR